MGSGHTIKHKPKHIDWAHMEGVCAYDREQDEAGQGCALKKKEAGEGYDVHVFRAAR